MKPVLLIAIVAVAMIGTSVIPVHGEVLEKQADAGVLVKIHGDEITFWHSTHQMKDPHIFFADGNVNSIHRYHEDATMEILFNGMSVGIDDQCYVFPDGKAFCTTDEYSLKYFINDKSVSGIGDYIIQDNDRILITFGGETDEQIQEYLFQLNSIKIKSGDSTINTNNFGVTVSSAYPEIEITPEIIPEPTHESTINHSASVIAYFEDKNKKSMRMNLDQYPSNIFEFETLFDVLKDRGYGEGNLPSEAEWTKINRDEAGNFMKYKLAQQLYNMDIIIDDIKDRIKKLDISQSEKDSTMIDFEYHTNNVRHNTIQSLIGELAQVNSILLIQQETNEQILKDVSNYYNDIKVENNPWTESTIGQNSTPNEGGCLIATATYGSEMATEVQQLRELRDNTLLNTESGTAFMGTFNDIYYSFSPVIADYERENPYFKEAVKIAITPMLSSLSLMENANSESEVMSLGLSVIMLNIGMYLGVPAIVVIGIRKSI
jgi:hypothetical protein